MSWITETPLSGLTPSQLAVLAAVLMFGTMFVLLWNNKIKTGVSFGIASIVTGVAAYQLATSNQGETVLQVIMFVVTAALIVGAGIAATIRELLAMLATLFGATLTATFAATLTANAYAFGTVNNKVWSSIAAFTEAASFWLLVAAAIASVVMFFQRNRTKARKGSKAVKAVRTAPAAPRITGDDAHAV